MTSEQELRFAKEILDGKFELICKRMQLLCCPNYDECWLEGTGIIRADEKGMLSFQMVSPYGNTTAAPRRPTVPHGQFFGPTDHVMLCAVDENSREWRSNWFVPNPAVAAIPSNNWIMNHYIEQISYSEERSDNGESVGRQYICNDDDFPFDNWTQKVTTVGNETVLTQVSVDHHIRQIASAKVEFRSIERKWLTVETRQETPVMPNWSGLICQALSFVTAKTIRPVVEVREVDGRRDIGLYSGQYLAFRTQLSPPIVRYYNSPDDFWTMVQKFIEWAVASPDRAQPVFDELAGIRSGATGSLETACLTLAIGIEALAAIVLINEPVQKKAELDPEQVSELRKYVKRWAGSEAVRDRALQALGPLGGKPSSVDRLYAFAERICLPHELLDRWKACEIRKPTGNRQQIPRHCRICTTLPLKFCIECWGIQLDTLARLRELRSADGNWINRSGAHPYETALGRCAMTN